MRAVDPHEIRDWMTRIRVASYARAGTPVSASDIERQVVADCEFADGARRAGDIAAGPRLSTPATPPPPPRRDDPLAKAQQETGTRLIRGENQYERHALIHGDPTSVSEKWAKACGRMKRIVETANTSTSDLAKAADSAELGPLVVEVADLWSHWMLRHKPPPAKGVDRNPFRGLRTRDALRKLERMVYDICDRSTGKLGHWYTK